MGEGEDWVIHQEEQLQYLMKTRLMEATLDWFSREMTGNAEEKALRMPRKVCTERRPMRTYDVS